MSLKFLHLNDKKTEVMLFGPGDASKVNVDLVPLHQYLTHSATNLGLRLYIDLKLEVQIKSEVFSTETNKSFLTQHEFEILIHAFITTRLDYCNALYVGLRDHVTPIFVSLHWFPILLFVFKCLSGLTPQYLFDLLHILSERQISHC